MLEKIQKINLLQRIWVFIIGTTRPNMLTQVSVIIGFCVWLYFFSWHLLSFITLSLMGTLDKTGEINAAFNRIGSHYQLLLPGNITTYLWIHALVQLIVFGVSLTGLILIWRQKKIGFLLYIFSNAATWVVTFLLLGMAYMWNEISRVDFLLMLLVTVYFGLGYWIFYRNK
ncbi:MAG: hypothetical protein HYZ14_06710 [Bacteroidetes bacterium]|nr:hypothetical protein [Bacteroidota bacterium]